MVFLGSSRQVTPYIIFALFDPVLAKNESLTLMYELNMSSFILVMITFMFISSLMVEHSHNSGVVRAIHGFLSLSLSLSLSQYVCERVRESTWVNIGRVNFDSIKIIINN